MTSGSTGSAVLPWHGRCGGSWEGKEGGGMKGGRRDEGRGGIKGGEG